MNPSSKGWIKKYLSIIDKSMENLNRFPDHLFSVEELIYSYVQPTGLIYGYPRSFMFIEKTYIDKLTPEEALKILLFEGLILVDFAEKRYFKIETLGEAVHRFVDFYEKSNLEKAKKSWLEFSSLDSYEKLESIINQRVAIKGKLSSKLTMNYLFNGLLFHDLILYQDYKNQTNRIDLATKRFEIMLDIIKVVAISANSDGFITDDERSIFKLFLASANFVSEKRELAESYLEQDLSLDDLSLNYHLSDLLKQYILEIAILTIWSNKELSASESKFLSDLTERLGLTKSDKDKSFLAIQSFVLSNDKTAHFLDGKNDFELILNGAARRWTKILSRNKDKLAHELKESKELVHLIGKSTQRDLSKVEKEKVKSQLADLGKTIPALTLFMLPGGAIILPLVLKIIPNLIPSAFRENTIEPKDK